MKLPRLFSASLLAACALCASLSLSQAADTAKNEHVTARLLSDARSVEAGGIITVGIHQRIKPRWHTYWQNPGDASLRLHNPLRLVSV